MNKAIGYNCNELKEICFDYVFFRYDALIYSDRASSMFLPGSEGSGRASSMLSPNLEEEIKGKYEEMLKKIQRQYEDGE